MAEFALSQFIQMLTGIANFKTLGSYFFHGPIGLI